MESGSRRKARVVAEEGKQKNLNNQIVQKWSNMMNDAKGIIRTARTRSTTYVLCC